MENQLSSSGIFSPDLLHWTFSRRSKNICKIKTLSPDTFQDELIFMSKWYGTHNYKLEGKWDSITAEMVGHFRETGHTVFKGISALNRGMRTRRSGRCAVHFNAASSTTELLFRTIQSANQLGIYGAVSSWCEEFAQWNPNQNELTVEKSGAKENEKTQKCKAARSEFFGINSKEQRGDIWKQITRTTSEIWNTGEGNPIYEKEIQFTRARGDPAFVRRVSVWMGIQSYSLRRWWF